jgi:hypothetical protein
LLIEFANQQTIGGYLPIHITDTATEVRVWNGIYRMGQESRCTPLRKSILGCRERIASRDRDGANHIRSRAMNSFCTRTIVFASSVLCLATVTHAQLSNFQAQSLLPVPSSNYGYDSTVGFAENPARWKQASPASLSEVQEGPITVLGEGHFCETAPAYDHACDYGHSSCTVAPDYQVPTPARCDGNCDAGSAWIHDNHRDWQPMCDHYGAKNSFCGLDSLSHQIGNYLRGWDGSCWFGSVGSVVMNRDRGNVKWLSVDSGDPTNSLLGSYDAKMAWSGGVEARVGRYIDGCALGLEAVYWGVYPNAQAAYALDPTGVIGDANDLNSVPQFRTLDITGVAAIDWYDQATVHMLRRNYEFHNLEVNLLGSCCGCLNTSCCRGPRLRCSWAIGARWFKFDEDFLFATSESNANFDWDADDVGYWIGVENDLFGGQWGGRLEYCLTPRLSIYAASKVGVYNNHMRLYQRVGTAADTALVNDPGGPNDGRAFNVRSSKNEVALLGEADLGLRYQMWRRWSVAAGYRAVGVTGVALSTNQIPHDFADIDGAADIDANGSMILHGGYARIEYNY